ncbi:MAG: TetR/AcrR family transcriptional regulator, partial [Caulobacteraceae bacterium]
MPGSPPHAPRKSPAQARSAATVSAILEAAARVLEDQGLEGYTTNAIARRAGVSIGSLYQYFPGKEAITRALIERQAAALLDEVRALDGCEDGRAGLAQLIRAAVGYQLDRPALARLLDFEERRLPLGDEIASVEQTIHATLERLLGRPDLPPQADPATAAHDLLAIAKGLT